MSWPTHTPRQTRRHRISVDPLRDHVRSRIYDVVHCDGCERWSPMLDDHDSTGSGRLAWSHSQRLWLCSRCFFRPQPHAQERLAEREPEWWWSLPTESDYERAEIGDPGPISDY